MLLQSNPPVGVAGMMDWHVRAASLPGTRWHGLYAIVPEADDLHYCYDQRQKGLRLAGVPATGQLRQIAGTFSDVTSGQVRSIREEARKNLAIPEVPPARRHEEDVWGVGPNTGSQVWIPGRFLHVTASASSVAMPSTPAR